MSDVAVTQNGQKLRKFTIDLHKWINNVLTIIICCCYAVWRVVSHTLNKSILLKSPTFYDIKLAICEARNAIKWMALGIGRHGGGFLSFFFPRPTGAAVLLSHKFFRVISSRREIVDGGAISFFFVVDVARIGRLGGPDSMFYNVHTSK